VATNQHSVNTDPQGYAVPLTDLLAGLECTLTGRPLSPTLSVSAVCDNSAQVGPSSLFVAVRGSKFDGHKFVDGAIDKGAVAAVVEKGVVSEKKLAAKEIAIVVVPDTRAVLAHLVSAFFSHPASEMTMIGITGTNGKTTVSYLMEQALTGFGIRTGLIGTVAYRYYNAAAELVSRPAPLTTPDPVTLQATLREMADSGVSHIIMEASSHALQQQRLGPIDFDLAIFTNLSQDHLDYHRTMEEYFSAKCLLFKKHMRPDGAVVVVEQKGADSGETPSQHIVALCRSLSLKTIVCGESADSDFKLTDYSTALSGVTFRLADCNGNRYQIDSALIGSFNVTNLQTSYVSLITLDFDPARTAALLSKAAGAPGRIERIDLADKIGGQPTVIVDYAHTPDALEKVLTALNDLEYANLFCIVGCGGDRDKSKRPLMGQIAARLADVVIVTDDNPRTEDPASIRKAVVKGVKRTGLVKRSLGWLSQRRPGDKGYIEIGARGEAIAAGVTHGSPGDIVLISGKGHENYQILGTEKRFFDDTLRAQNSSLTWDLQTIAVAAKGTIVSGDPSTHFKNVSTDSRTISSNDIFVALSGEVFDGHNFLDKAVENGAGCLLVSDAERVPSVDICCVQVDDTLTALGDLANYRLNQVREIGSPIVVGLTGSCGKTTVKDMTSSILLRRWPNQPDMPQNRVLKTLGNLNNLIGLPLSLLPVLAHHRGLVLEMGMNSPGEIARLARIGDPDVCCITNVHQAHLEGLGSVEGVAAAKGELFEQSRPDAVHVINYDDEHIVGLSEKFSNTTVGYATTKLGLSRTPLVWAESAVADDDGHLSFILHVGEKSQKLTIQTPGLHNVSNCCAAAAISYAAGIDFDSIITGLEQFRSSSNRMERLTCPSGLKILNDSYNANPASMASGLRTLGSLPAGNRLAVLGDMLELGEASADLHRSIGNVAAQSDLSFLALIGDFADQMRQGALTSGMDPDRVRIFADKNEVVDWITELIKNTQLQAGDWLLVKASRGLALDTVVDQIMEQC